MILETFCLVEEFGAMITAGWFRFGVKHQVTGLTIIIRHWGVVGDGLLQAEDSIVGVLDVKLLNFGEISEQTENNIIQEQTAAFCWSGIRWLPCIWTVPDK